MVRVFASPLAMPVPASMVVGVYAIVAVIVFEPFTRSRLVSAPEKLGVTPLVQR